MQHSIRIATYTHVTEKFAPACKQHFCEMHAASCKKRTQAHLLYDVYSYSVYVCVCVCVCMCALSNSSQPITMALKEYCSS